MLKKQKWSINDMPSCSILQIIQEHGIFYTICSNLIWLEIAEILGPTLYMQLEIIYLQYKPIWPFAVSNIWKSKPNIENNLSVQTENVSYPPIY